MHYTDILSVVPKQVTMGNEITDEDSFLRFWLSRLEAGVITSDDLAVIATGARYATDEIVMQICHRRGLSTNELDMLLKTLPIDRYGHSQLLAYKALHDMSLSWQEKLEKSMKYRADWATNRLIACASADFLVDASTIIAKSSRPKSTKAMFQRAIDERRDQLTSNNEL